MSKGVAGWVGGWPYFVYGWREVFVPLVVLVHNQHGPSLAVAGLALAATRLGGWLVHKTSLRRPLSEASLLCGVALLFLGLAPEEGPVSLLLWFLFGLGWPALHAGLAGRLWQGWAGLAVLLVGMVAAGPLARGPGAWVIAAGCLLLAWQTRAPMQQVVEVEQAQPVEEYRWIPFFWSVAYLGWVWLLPIRLGEGTWAPELFAGVMALGWLARGLSAAAFVRFLQDQGSAGSRVSHSSRHIYDPAVAALLLVPSLAALALAPQLVLVALAFVVYSVLMGVISTGPGIARGEQGQLPDTRQALGEWAGPLLGAGLLLVGGPTAVFAAAALAAVALAWSLIRR
jgi:hypothetical protein